MRVFVCKFGKSNFAWRMYGNFAIAFACIYAFVNAYSVFPELFCVCSVVSGRTVVGRGDLISPRNTDITVMYWVSEMRSLSPIVTHLTSHHY